MEEKLIEAVRPHKILYDTSRFDNIVNTLYFNFKWFSKNEKTGH